MVDDSSMFDLSVPVLVAGLAIMLYGVSLNDGQSLNAVIAAGGLVVVAAIGLLTAGVVRLDAEPDTE